MPREALILNNPTVVLAATQSGLDAGDAFECQITSAVLTPTPVYNTIPATGCSGASQSPGRTGWGFVVAWLQDWGNDDGLSQYAFANDTLPVWYRFVADKVQYPDLTAEGQVYMSAGAMGGTFGDGSAAPATATWPCLATPTIDNTATAATGATAGTPGTWTPSGATPPANAAGATSAAVTAAPASAWTTGQYVQGSTAGSGGEMTWTGSAWAAGKGA